ncbi:MAG: glutaminyl-peptide cyclotransferase, partial [Actinobacteria bacterium]
MTIAGTLSSSIRRGLAALLIAASIIACSDSANEPTSASQTSFTTSTASASSTRAPATTAQLLRVDVISRRPHDSRSFTEGLVMAGGRLYEGSGLRGESTLREVNPQTGVVDRSIAIDRPYFGEGIAVVDDRIIQLTWQEHTAFVYQL